MTMLKRLFLKKTAKEKASKYAGFSDFLLRATPEERARVLTEAARKANEDQLKIFRRAQSAVK